ncbi:SDR family oxidoreductase [Oceanicoccus sp. KOV_DT_Chl]|uniref:SDR family NAD(P)-dependent oxidoreductase n=1 Tax=Oceanicoccus sp. KOV_DT_Chl TaxID=1904639 RepID=UPI000C7C9333|nr:SDR family oxidoreductase [Oceanicoccus sp. KOV_DT_Chl]
MKKTRETVLITGAWSGIGKGLALVSAQHNYDVILVARSADKLEALAAQLSHEYTIEVTVRPCDLAAPGSVKFLCEGLIAEGKQIDILVNCAGTLEHGAFVNMSADDHQRILQLNVAAHTAMLSYLLPPMVARGAGKILNVASLGACQPLPSVAVYAASKAYVLSLSEALMEEVRGSGVTVTVLCPGLTATGMMSGAKQKNRNLRSIPNWVVGDPNAVARQAFRACLKGDAIVIPGVRNHLTSIFSRATPKWLVRRVVGILGRATLPRA